MRAVKIVGAGGPEVLTLVEDYELPEPAAGEVRVRVRACGLNRADVLQRRGFYPAPPGAPADVPGLEFAGEVEADAGGWQAGDRVMGITAGGAMAERIDMPGDQLLRIPEGLSFEHAAAFPETYLTAFDALIRQADLRLGERVLVHAVASGVGTAAMQIARATGAKVIGTSRSQAKLDRCREWGLERGICTADGFTAAMLEDIAGVSVVLDLVGAKYFAENLRALGPQGVIVVVGLVGGVKAEIDLGLLLRKRAIVRGTVLRSRSAAEKAALIDEAAGQLLPLLEDEVLHPLVDDVLPMGEIAQAHERMERNETFGKLVLTW